MKKLSLLAASPLLLASQFAASEFEFAAHFVALLQQHNLNAAKRMLSPNVVIRSWDSLDRQKSLGDFAAYIASCPIHDLEGVDTKDAHNINVNLDCEGQGGASLEFASGKISAIRFGPPPPINISVSPPTQ